MIQEKPTVPFDATNKNHRAQASNFIKNSRWTPDGVRFKLKLEYASVPAMITSELINYYTSKEFKNVTKD